MQQAFQRTFFGLYWQSSVNKRPQHASNFQIPKKICADGPRMTKVKSHAAKMRESSSGSFLIGQFRYESSTDEGVYSLAGTPGGPPCENPSRFLSHWLLCYMMQQDFHQWKCCTFYSSLNFRCSARPPNAESL